MLYDETIRKINQQIEIELRNVDSLGSTDDEKMAALERIAKLKALFDPQPTSEMIRQELASIIVNVCQKENDVPTHLSLAEIFRVFVSKR